MPKFEGFDVWVEINGKRLEEYKVETNQEAKEVVCWIPCESGKEFRIGYNIPLDRDTATNHMFGVQLDGNLVKILGSMHLRRSENSPQYLSEIYSSFSATRPLQFGCLELTDDEAYLKKTTKDFGKILFSIFSVESFVPSTTPWENTMELDENKVHERTKKGLTDCVGFGQEKVLLNKHIFYQPVGWKKLCNFVFNYRRMDVLLANDIAPRLNSPSSRAGPSQASWDNPSSRRVAGTKRKIDNVKSEAVFIDLTTGDWEIQALEARLALLKKNREEQPGGSQPKRVKTEGESANLSSGEAIDLTL